MGSFYCVTHCFVCGEDIHYTGDLDDGSTSAGGLCSGCANAEELAGLRNEYPGAVGLGDNDADAAGNYVFFYD